MRVQRIVFGVIALLLFNACGINVNKHPASAPSPEVLGITTNPDAQISYAQINQVIFQPSCLDCHNAQKAKGGVVLDSYEKVEAQIQKIQAEIDSGDMPDDGALPSDQVQLFDRWVAQGYPNQVKAVDATPTPSPTPTPISAPAPTATPVATPNPTLVASYQSIHDYLFVQKCLTCHGVGGRAYDDVPLEPYASMMLVQGLVSPGNPENSDLIQAIESGSMPTKKSGLPPVTPDELQIVKNWISNGALSGDSNPNPAVSPTATPAPTTTPNPVVAPAPTATPDPVVTPAPIATPNPVVAPAPTATPNPITAPAPTPAPVDTPTPSPAPVPTLAPSYQSIRDIVFTQKCLTCHGIGGRVYSKVPLEPLSAVLAVPGLVVSGNPEASDLVKAIESGSMPTKRSGLPKVTADELLTIKNWIQNGVQP